MDYRKARWSGRALGLSLLVLSAGVLGCVEDVGLIDRTQPNKVPKAQFQGVWYNVQTVVDIPPTSGFTFIGETYTGPSLSSASKVIFDIQEKYLLVYPVVEFVEGAEKDYVVKRQIRNYWKTDGDGELVDEMMEIYTGQPIAAYRILSHFDVQRQYSAATGEENNVVEENTTDRKWWQRKYIRVDWSKNEIMDFGFIARSIAAQGVDYYVQDWEEGNPDRPLFTDDAILITTKMFAQPTSPYACEAIQGSAYAADTDCAGVVVKVRNAYRKVDPNADYVPQRYHVNLEQDKFGFFLTERYNYDDRFGVTHEGKVSLINRWNLWDQSRDVKVAWDGNTAASDGVKHNELAECLTRDDCEGVADAELGPANHCWLDEWFEPGHCVRWEIRPVHERPVKPIIYHLSAVWPEPLRAEAYQLADEYDEVYKDTVAWAKYWSGRGLLHPKACTTNADCSQDALVDVEFEAVIECATDGDCESLGALCDKTARRCGRPVACSETAPCDLGQTCVDDRCMEGGQQVLDHVTAYRPTTVVLYQDGDETKSLEIWGESKLDNSADHRGEALVRFVNATPGTTGAQLRVAPFGSATLQNVGGTANFDETMHSPLYETLELEGAERVMDVYVEVGGQQKARRTYVRFQEQHSYLVVFAGGDQVYVVDHEMTSAVFSRGVRVVNAITTGEPIDVGFNGALRGPAMEPGEATEWMKQPPDRQVQRVTAVRTGQNANVTCYYYEGIGQCVGWKPEFGSAQAAEVANLRAGLPHMYVVCENVYTGDDCEFDANGNPADPHAMSDCRYSRKDPASGAISNPCKDRVPDHDRLKLHGDVRYSFLYWIPEDQAASPLGYGPSAGDPDTGEIFYGIAHVYGGPMETYGTYARDLIWLVNGVRDDGTPFGEDDVISSRYIREYVDQVERPEEYRSLNAALSADDAPDAATDHFTTRIEETELPPAFRNALATAAPPLANHPVKLSGAQQRQVQELTVIIDKALRAGSKVPSDNPGRARLDRIRGTWIEDLMITDEVKWGLTGGDPASVADFDRNKLSPATWMSMEARDREHERILHLARHNVMVADFADESLVAMARKLGCEQEGEVETDDLYDPDLGAGKCLKGENLRWGIMARLFGGTLEHEVGHTVGLRHNFTGSTDPFNFQDEYFAIRERELVGCPILESGAFSDPSEYCEPNEECDTIYECSTDAHCPSLTRCTGGQCQDIYARRWGVCTAPTTITTTCQADADCGGSRFDKCVGGLCHEQAACDVETPCSQNQLCSADGVCTDLQGAPVATLVEKTQVLPVRKFVSRPAPTQREIDLNRMEYQYSSLMDYGGGINFDVHGLGKYDRAALMFGYGELVEVWQDSSGIDRWMLEAANGNKEQAAEQWGWRKDTTYWKYTGGVSESDWGRLSNLVGIEANLKRIPAPWRQVLLEQSLVMKDYLRDAADVSWVEVPYKFCSDEYRGQMSSGGCYYFDLGADIMEIVYHSTMKLREYYVFDAFKRELYNRNMGGNGAGYFARILDRWLRPMGDAGMYWGLYSGIFNQYGPLYVDAYAHTVHRMWPLETTARTSLQILSELVASPAPGTYVLDEEANRWVNVNYQSKLPKDELQPGEANIPFGLGKFPYTTFSDEGYWRYDHALWIGSFWEKMAALLTLTDSTANFLSDYVGEQLNVGVGSATGFNTTYPAIMGNFLGGLVAGAPEFTAGTIDPLSREYASRNVLDASAPADETPVVPNSIDNLTMQLYAAVYGLSYMPAGFDPAFIDALAVTIKGSGDDFDHGGSIETVEFTDPFGKKTYIARLNAYDEDVVEGRVTDQFPWDDQPRIDAAARVIADANAALAEWEAAEAAGDTVRAQQWRQVISQKVQVLDLLRTLNEIYGDIVY